MQTVHSAKKNPELIELDPSKALESIDDRPQYGVKPRQIEEAIRWEQSTAVAA